MVLWIIGAIMVFIAVVSFGGEYGKLMRAQEPERWRRSMYLALAVLVGGIALIVIGLVG